MVVIGIGVVKGRQAPSATSQVLQATGISWTVIQESKNSFNLAFHIGNQTTNLRAFIATLHL